MQRHSAVSSGAARSRSNSPKLFIIGLRCGRLANRLVLFATFMALVEEQKHRVINFTFHSYAKDFRATCGDIYCQYPAPERRSWIDAIPGLARLLRATRVCHHGVRAAIAVIRYLPGWRKKAVVLRSTPGQQITGLTSAEFQESIRDAEVVFIYNWRFRAPELVRRHAAKIREYFRPAEVWERASSEVVDHLRRKADVVVGVHIRRGDYRRWKQGRFFYPVSRYAGWMREIADHYAPRTVAFLVCGDEPREESEFPGLTVGFGVGSAVGDLFALAKCDCLMGPPSSFSQWASFYGNKPLLHLYSADTRVSDSQFTVSDLGEIPGHDFVAPRGDARPNG